MILGRGITVNVNHGRSIINDAGAIGSAGGRRRRVAGSTRVDNRRKRERSSESDASSSGHS